MKPSKYNFFWTNKQRDEHIIYNSFTGATEVFSGDIGLAAGDILKNEQSFESFSEQISLGPLVDRLYAKGFLIADGRDELSEIQQSYRSRKYGVNAEKRWGISIAPSMACNFDCSYCYAAVKSGSNMSSDTADLLILRIKEYIINNDIKNLAITWVGGEPLCGLDAMRRISNEISSFCSSVKCDYHAILITNASLISEDVAKELSGPNFPIRLIQITVDGEFHDANRPFKGNSNRSSLEATLNGLKNAVNNFPSNTVSVRVNVPSNSPECTPDGYASFMYEILKEIDVLGKVEPHLAPIIFDTEEARLNYTDDDNWVRREWLQFREKFDKIFAEKCGKTYTPKIPSPLESQSSCDSISGVCVDSYGNISKCWSHLGHPEKTIGSISKPFHQSNYLDSAAYHKWLRTEAITEMCLACKSLPLCFGGCYNLIFENGPDDEIRCTEMKLTLEKDIVSEIDFLLHDRPIPTCCGS